MTTKQTINITGKTTEDKFKYVERVLQRMFRRVHKTVIGAMPKIPVFLYAPEPINGVLGRYIIPGNCKLTGLHIFVGIPTMDEKGDSIEPVVKLEVARDGDTQSKLVSPSDATLSSLIPLYAGDLLTISTEMAIKQISVTGILDFGKDMYSMKDIMITELEKELNKNPTGDDDEGI